MKGVPMEIKEEFTIKRVEMDFGIGHISKAYEQALKLSAYMKTEVKFEFNDKVYCVQYADLCDCVKEQ
jgi:hypothetical protein